MTAQARPFLLITRPEPGASRFAAEAAARRGGALRIVVAPLMGPVWRDAALPPALAAGEARGLVFTSAAGVAGLARLAPGLRLPAYCVGAQTAAAATRAGHAAEALGGDAAALVAALAARRPRGPLVHARGAQTAGDVAGALRAAGLHADEVVVYAQAPLPLAAAAAAALAGTAPVIVPLFSPRSAALFAAAAAGARAPLWLAAISAAALAGAGALPAARRATALRPDAAGMAGAIDQLLAAAPRA